MQLIQTDFLRATERHTTQYLQASGKSHKPGKISHTHMVVWPFLPRLGTGMRAHTLAFPFFRLEVDALRAWAFPQATGGKRVCLHFSALESRHSAKRWFWLTDLYGGGYRSLWHIVGHRPGPQGMPQSPGLDCLGGELYSLQEREMDLSSDGIPGMVSPAICLIL